MPDDETPTVYSCSIASREAHNSLTVGASLGSDSDHVFARTFVTIENHYEKVTERSDLVIDWPESELLYMGLACESVAARDSTTAILGNAEDGSIHVFGALQVDVAGTTFFISSFESRKLGVVKVIDAYCPVKKHLYSHWHLVFTKDAFERFTGELLATGRLIEQRWREGNAGDGQS